MTTPNKKNRILITGANGFVGKALALHLTALENFSVRVAVRKPSTEFPTGIQVFDHLDLQHEEGWVEALTDIDCVIHCAARVHIMNENSKDPLSDFRKLNVDGTLKLAQKAAVVGVKRFIFLSSLKVNGEKTSSGKPFTADDTAYPQDPYGISKLEAEKGLFELSKKSGLEIVIVRPPLIYGPGVKANFAFMMSCLNQSIPLPLALTHNKRSLVALDNLIDFLKVCCVHPAAANQTLMVSDDEDLSTTQLLRRIGTALGKKPILIPVPPFVLKMGAAVLGKSHLTRRLLDSLQVDISKSKKLLQWSPPISMQKALKQTAAFFLSEKTNRGTTLKE